jgi:hypothetical protein
MASRALKTVLPRDSGCALPETASVATLAINSLIASRLKIKELTTGRINFSVYETSP